MPGEVRVNLIIFYRERLTKNLGGFFVKAHRSQHIRELISQRRKLSKLSRIADRSLCIEGTLQSQQRASHRDLSPRVTRLDSDSFTSQFKRLLVVVVSGQPVCGA